MVMAVERATFSVISRELIVQLLYKLTIEEVAARHNVTFNLNYVAKPQRELEGYGNLIRVIVCHKRLKPNFRAIKKHTASNCGCRPGVTQALVTLRAKIGFHSQPLRPISMQLKRESSVTREKRHYGIIRRAKGRKGLLEHYTILHKRQAPSINGFSKQHSRIPPVFSNVEHAVIQTSMTV